MCRIFMPKFFRQYWSNSRYILRDYWEDVCDRYIRMYSKGDWDKCLPVEKQIEFAKRIEERCGRVYGEWFSGTVTRITFNTDGRGAEVCGPYCPIGPVFRCVYFRQRSPYSGSGDDYNFQVECEECGKPLLWNSPALHLFRGASKDLAEDLMKTGVNPLEDGLGTWPPRFVAEYIRPKNRLNREKMYVCSDLYCRLNPREFAWYQQNRIRRLSRTFGVAARLWSWGELHSDGLTKERKMLLIMAHVLDFYARLHSALEWRKKRGLPLKKPA